MARLDRLEVERDFSAIAAAGFDSVRLFLTWEHFQPTPHRIDEDMLARLVVTLDLAHRAGLDVMPTLFTGHMSGVNWIPSWAVGGREGDPRFRVVSAGRVVRSGLRSWYGDSRITRAQADLARTAARALAGHPALWAWDLGNESSNCVIPGNRAEGRDWLHRMADAIHESDVSARITLGLHMEDLAEDRLLGPTEAREVCDFLTMHGYPGYAPWAGGPTDHRLLPFLALITRWLARGVDIVFSELGVPTYRVSDPDAATLRAACATELVKETEAATYVERALGDLHACGCRGAMLWCFADYLEPTWRDPPLDRAVHERHFGLWRADASPKPAVLAVRARAADAMSWRRATSDTSWIDIDPNDFYLAPNTLQRLYRRYCHALSVNSA
ncbi:MAG: hypothetical protein R3B72_10330 [Polyangiaceae bacterium]